MRLRLREILKDAVLVCLLISTGYLTWKNWIYDERLLESPALSWLGLSRPESSSRAAVIEYADASFPTEVAVMADGQRSGARYDAVSVQGFYAAAKPVLGEALGSASSPAGLDEGEWRRKLSENGFYIAYQNRIPLSVLASFCGSALNAQVPDAEAAAVVLCRNGDSMELCYTDGKGFYSLSTAVPYAAAEGVVSSAGLGRAAFAYELGGAYGGVAPCTLVTEQELSPPSVLSASALDSDEKVAAMLKGLGLNPLTNRHYEEADDTRVFVEGSRTVRIFKDGRVVYRNSDGNGGEGGLFVRTAGGGFTPGEIIESVRRVVSKTAALFSGDATLYFSSLEDADGETRVTFNYMVGGIPVYFRDSGFAVQAAVENGVITRLSFKLRAYRLGGAGIPALLPQEQAAAALGAKSDGGRELTLGYVDDGSQELYAQWMGK